MGSKSDMDVMDGAASVLREADVRHEVRVMSAHREPDIVADYCKNARIRGLRVIIAGAGLSAALPGVAAAHTDLPVIGVPLSSRLSAMGGLDAILSVVQMPPGVPVARGGPRQRQERRAPGTANTAKLSASMPSRRERARLFVRGLVKFVALVAVAGGCGVAIGYGLSTLSDDENVAGTVASGDSLTTTTPTGTPTQPATTATTPPPTSTTTTPEPAVTTTATVRTTATTTTPAGPLARFRCASSGAILRPAGTPDGQQRRRARLTMRVQAVNPGGHGGHRRAPRAGGRQGADPHRHRGRDRRRSARRGRCGDDEGGDAALRARRRSHREDHDRPPRPDQHRRSLPAVPPDGRRAGAPADDARRRRAPEYAFRMVPVTATIHRLSVDDVYKMVESGVLKENDRVELVEGVLVDMVPIGAEHEDAVQWLD